MKIKEFNNVKFILGETAEENWNILDEAKKENEYYIWFHLNSFPSGYVIMYSTLTDLTDNVNEYLLFASNLCKNNTKYRNLYDIKICYSILKKLEKTKNVGEIIVRGKKNIIKI